MLSKERQLLQISQCDKQEYCNKYERHTYFDQTHSPVMLHYSGSNHIVEVEPMTNDYDGAHQLQCRELTL